MNPSLLLIEDNDDQRRALAVVLKQQGYTVWEARDGEEGLAVFRVAEPDLVITEIVMPNKEGIATIMDLRREEPKLGIIAMSGSQNAPQYLKLASSLGANRTLAKPFDGPTLLATIEAVLAECRPEVAS
jgi:DNA-binding response OmpR family regulator